LVTRALRALVCFGGFGNEKRRKRPKMGYDGFSYERLKLAGEYYEQWTIFALGGEAVLEAIALLLVGEWYFPKGM